MPDANSAQRYRSAFTIPELLLSLSIFLVCVLGIVTLQILGLKMSAISASKMESTQASLKTLNAVRNEVLGANTVLVGNGDDTSFTATGTNGNALQVYPTMGLTNYYLRFYLCSTNNKLYELNSSNDTSTLTVIAPNITNDTVFQTVDFQGNTSSSSREHYAIKMTLQFAQLDYKVPTNKWEYFTLETEMTPRTQ